jgi:2-polyprenyl-6-methoxyphenol hydroxylase-like FAD-dependent oxidoreductase
MRADLVTELRAAAAESGAHIVTGQTLVDVVPLAGRGDPNGHRASDGGGDPNGHRAPDRGGAADGQRVEARFGGGRTETAELVVGADGIWSTTRGVLDAGAPSPRYSGMFVVSGRTRAADLDGGVDVRPGAFNMAFCRAGAFIYLVAPDGEVWWQAQVTTRDQPTRDGVPDDEWRRRLGEVYRRDRVPAGIIAASHTLHRPTLQHALGPVGVWHNDSVVLVGDAVHPVGAGQGAAMAIEDGLALASALATTPAVPQALRVYAERRRPRVTKMLKASDDNRDAKRAGAVRLRLQELVMPLVLPHVFERATAWLYDYTPEPLPSR